AWAPAAIAASIATLGSAAGVGFAAYSGATLAGKPLLEAFGLSAESTLGASKASAAESYAAWAPAAIAASIATLGSAAGVGFAAYSGATLAGK
ncbi:hypothetical protein, partial [Enterobacter hormaechei]|uniref:hypothetical protein n=1 Tax=Enterobacter hormaechei TaxID=158836 RepID=UPI00197ABE8F